MEGIDKAEIDKLNLRLSELIASVKNVTDGSLKTIKSDIDTLNADYQWYKEKKPSFMEMVKQSEELTDNTNNAKNSVEYDEPDVVNKDDPDEYI